MSHGAHTVVGDLMTPDPVALHVDDPLDRARREMERGGIRHLPVVDRDGKLVGLLSHRDLGALAPELHGRVGDLMAEDPLTVAAETPAWEAAYLILHRRIGSLPVTDGSGRLIGIVTETDFVRAAYHLLGGRAPIDQLEREEREAEDV